MSSRPIEQVLKDMTGQWMTIPGVVGTAIGATANGEPCIKIYTASQPEKLRNKVPRTVDDYPVIIEHTGTFRAFTNEQ